MDIVFWIILIVVAAVIVWWLVNRNKRANPPGGSPAKTGTSGTRADGALEGGSAAASAQAAGTTGIPTAAGFGRPAEPAAPATADEPADSAATPVREAAAGAAGITDRGTSGPGASGSPAEFDERRRQEQAADRAADEAEWETQWSESGTETRPGSSAAGATATPPAASPEAATSETAAHHDAEAEASAAQPSPAAAEPVHHEEYTALHAPTLPGAETAAVESADDDGTGVAGQAGEQQTSRQGTETSAPAGEREAVMPPTGGGIHGNAGAAETLERAQSSALVENAADHQAPTTQGQGLEQGQDFSQGQATAVPEPAGHLAADEPYGAGSAAAGPDGSGPGGYTVKGDAAAMVYFEEGHPDYEQTRAEVWFESAAHAEAAGFRAPRRKRL